MQLEFWFVRPQSNLLTIMLATLALEPETVVNCWKWPCELVTSHRLLDMAFRSYLRLHLTVLWVHQCSGVFVFRLEGFLLSAVPEDKLSTPLFLGSRLWKLTGEGGGGAEPRATKGQAPWDWPQWNETHFLSDWQMGSKDLILTRGLFWRMTLILIWKRD